jgi:hypothetical protein
MAYSLLTLIQQTGQGGEQPLWLTMYQTWAEIIWRGATVLAIGVGGFFAWYKFWRGREFAQRVIPKLSAGNVSRGDGMIYLRADASAKNIGLSKVKIDSLRTCIVVELRERNAANFKELAGVERVFQTQGMLEPNEEVGEPIMIPIADGNYLEAKLHLYVYAAGRRTRRFYVVGRRVSRYWVSSCFVDLAESAHQTSLFERISGIVGWLRERN